MDRMLRRMVTFAATPVVIGVALLPLFYYLKVCLIIFTQRMELIEL